MKMIWEPSRYSMTFVVVQSLSHASLSATQWTEAHLALLLMGLSRQEYWSRLTFPSPEDLPNPRTEPTTRVSCIVFTYNYP